MLFYLLLIIALQVVQTQNLPTITPNIVVKLNNALNECKETICYTLGNKKNGLGIADSDSNRYLKITPAPMNTKADIVYEKSAEEIKNKLENDYNELKNNILCDETVGTAEKSIYKDFISLKNNYTSGHEIEEIKEEIEKLFKIYDQIILINFKKCIKGEHDYCQKTLESALVLENFTTLLNLQLLLEKEKILYSKTGLIIYDGLIKKTIILSDTLKLITVGLFIQNGFNIIEEIKKISKNMKDNNITIVEASFIKEILNIKQNLKTNLAFYNTKPAFATDFEIDINTLYNNVYKSAFEAFYKDLFVKYEDCKYRENLDGYYEIYDCKQLPRNEKTNPQEYISFNDLFNNYWSYEKQKELSELCTKTGYSTLKIIPYLIAWELGAYYFGKKLTLEFIDRVTSSSPKAVKYIGGLIFRSPKVVKFIGGFLTSSALLGIENLLIEKEIKTKNEAKEYLNLEYSSGLSSKAITTDELKDFILLIETELYINRNKIRTIVID